MYLNELFSHFHLQCFKYSFIVVLPYCLMLSAYIEVLYLDLGVYTCPLQVSTAHLPCPPCEYTYSCVKNEDIVCSTFNHNHKSDFQYNQSGICQITLIMHNLSKEKLSSAWHLFNLF